MTPLSVRKRAATAAELGWNREADERIASPLFLRKICEEEGAFFHPCFSFDLGEQLGRLLLFSMEL